MGPEEIIPFLVFVFYVVRTIMAQKNKAEKQRKRAEKSRPVESYKQQPEPAQRRPKDIFESENPEIDILEELFGKKEDITAPPKAIPARPLKSNSLKNIELTEQRIADKMRKDYEVGLVEFKNQIGKSFARKQIHNKKRRRNYAKHSVIDVDLKKAVIFSEILKRPYE